MFCERWLYRSRSCKWFWKYTATGNCSSFRETDPPILPVCRATHYEKWCLLVSVSVSDYFQTHPILPTVYDNAPMCLSYRCDCEGDRRDGLSSSSRCITNITKLQLRPSRILDRYIILVFQSRISISDFELSMIWSFHCLISDINLPPQRLYERRPWWSKYRYVVWRKKEHLDLVVDNIGDTVMDLYDCGVKLCSRNKKWPKE